MKPVFVRTENVKDFVFTMEIVKKRIGHDSLAMVSGRAGRGKTRTAKWYATQNDCVYLTSLRDWSVLWMYQDILAAMGRSAPKRRKDAFEAIVAACRDNPRIIILDEADLLGSRLLESVRDLCKMACVPWVLVGEESLPILMNKDRRVWSRRCASMEFQPMSVADIATFCREAAGLSISAESADLVQRKTGGDIRLIELILSAAESAARASQVKEISVDIAQTSLKKVIPEAAK